MLSRLAGDRRPRSASLFVVLAIAAVLLASWKPLCAQNATQTNADETLDALNMGGRVAIWFARSDTAEAYILFVSISPEGPWRAVRRIEADDLPPKRIPSTVDLGGDDLDGEPRSETALFRERTLYYRMDVVGADGAMRARYRPVRVPPFATGSEPNPPGSRRSPGRLSFGSGP